MTPLGAITAERRSVSELYSIALDKQTLGSPQDTICIRGETLKNSLVRRYTDGSLVTHHNEVFGRVRRLASLTETRRMSNSRKNSALAMLESEEDYPGTALKQESQEPKIIEGGLVGRRFGLSQLSEVKLHRKLSRLELRDPMKPRSKSVLEMVLEVDTSSRAQIKPPGSITKIDAPSPDKLISRRNARNDALAREIVKNAKNTGSSRNLDISQRGIEVSESEVVPYDEDSDCERDGPGSGSDLQSPDHRRNSQAPSGPGPGPGPGHRRLCLPYRVTKLPLAVPTATLATAASLFFASASLPNRSLDPSPSPASSSTNFLINKRIVSDVIGCHHPIELINASAKKRSRQQSQVIATRDMAIALQEASAALNVQLKDSVRERKQLMVQSNQLREFWSKVVIIANVKASVASNLKTAMEASSMITRQRAAANKIILWYLKHIKRKHRERVERLETSLGPIKRLINRYTKYLRASLAVMRIRSLLDSHSRHTTCRFTIPYVRRFMSSLKTIQRCIRSFLRCRKARVMGVLKMWDTLEVQYIKTLLQRQRRQESGEMKEGVGAYGVAQHSTAYEQRDILSRSVSKRNRIRALKWVALKEKFRVFDSKFGHNVQKRIDADIRKGYQLPLATKLPIILKLIKDARSALLIHLDRDNLQQQLQENAAVLYSLKDAELLVRGEETFGRDEGEENEERASRNNCKKIVFDLECYSPRKEHIYSRIKRPPFLLFRYLRESNKLHHSIIDAHKLTKKTTAAAAAAAAGAGAAKGKI